MISFAEKNDINEIMLFIDNEWRKGHILARDRSFFEWMYVKDDKVNFVISRNDGNIDGILGFVPYDINSAQMALTVWKALKSSNGMIGMSMLAFIEKELQPRLIASPGVNPATTTAIYRYFKHEVGKMRHYYRLAKRDEFYIPTIQNTRVPAVDVTGIAEVRKLNGIKDYEEACIKYADNAIKKDSWYINRRYFEHPVFKYEHYLVNESLDVIIREQDVDGHKCLRVVDMLGDYSLLPFLSSTLDNIMARDDYEYVDCYASAIDKAVWDAAGWIDVEEINNVIPNYFAPFERSNIDLYFSSKPHGFVVMRGDGDQDRPN